MTPPAPLSCSIEIAASPQAVYDLVCDVTRTGEWSPVCRACWWDDGAGPRVGAWFSGRNEKDGRVWETRSQVVTAEPGRAFAWQVGEGWVSWAYTLETVPGGTRLTESWELTPGGVARFQERYGDGAGAQIADREQDARSGVPATLATLKRILEAA